MNEKQQEEKICELRLQGATCKNCFYYFKYSHTCGLQIQYMNMGILVMNNVCTMWSK